MWHFKHLKFKACVQKNSKTHNQNPVLHLHVLQTKLSTFCGSSDAHRHKKYLKKTMQHCRSIIFKTLTTFKDPRFPRIKCTGPARDPPQWTPIFFGTIRRAPGNVQKKILRFLGILGLCRFVHFIHWDSWNLGPVDALSSLKPLEILVLSRFCSIQRIVWSRNLPCKLIWNAKWTENWHSKIQLSIDKLQCNVPAATKIDRSGATILKRVVNSPNSKPTKQ